MENKIAVVVDSTTTLPQGFLTDLEIQSAPAIIIWGDEELRDGVDIQADEFYQRLATAKEMPSTSQATPVMFKEIYEDLSTRGFEILAVTISSKLSGMYASAMQAKESLRQARIEVVDSLTGTMTIGMSLGRMFEEMKKGASLEKCRQTLEHALENTGVIFTVETLEFLHRGGRIGGAAKFLGSALQLKPILEVVNGAFEGREKIRTRSKALERLVDLTIERIGDRRPVEITALHANAEDVAHKLIEMVEERIETVRTYVTAVSPAVGVHLGPGTVGLAFMAGIE
ncbi:MAG: DegV family protein [Anaerolineales bacterium]|nr:DegV family protein [Anaerolineales bacterium]